jgi:predicted RNase H-like HicB family nuclease
VLARGFNPGKWQRDGLFASSPAGGGTKMTTLQPEGSPFTADELAEASHYGIVIQWSAEDRVFLATVPDLPGVIAHADSPGEAATKAVEFAAHWIDGSRRLGDSIPEPRSLAIAS